MVDKLYEYLIIGLIICLAILIFFAIVKSIIGPKTADRIVAVNMISTMVIMILCALSVYYHTVGYLADISILYVLISFVSIVVLANVFINVNVRNKFKKDKKEDE